MPYNMLQEQPTGGAAGGGDWSDDLGTGADIDGVASFKSQGSSPSVTSGYGKVFAKEAAPGTILLMHNDTSSFVDSGPQSLTTTVTGATQDTSEKKIGTSSANLDGVNDFIALPANAGFRAGENWTWETWAYTAATAFEPFFLRLGADATKGFISVTPSAGTINLYFNDGSTVDITWTHTGAFPNGEWVHYALTKKGNWYYAWMNGAQVGSAVMNTTAWPASMASNAMWINKYRANGGSDIFSVAKLDEYRITSTAVYTSSFTPSTIAFDAADTSIFVLDDAGNETKISPHNPQGEWEYFSKNTKTGKVVRINMEEVVSDLGKLTGKNYIKDE